MENITNPKTLLLQQLRVAFLWRRGIVVVTSVQLHSIKLELRFCASSNPARGLSEILDDESLWQWSRLEIRLNSFHRLIIPQKTIHHRHHFANFSRSVQLTCGIVRNHMNSVSFVTLYRHCSRNDEKFSVFFRAFSRKPFSQNVSSQTLDRVLNMRGFARFGIICKI